MAENNKPFMVFQTKEEFDRLVEQMLADGEKVGFRKGVIMVLSNVYLRVDQISNLFVSDVVREAQEIKRDRQIKDIKRDPQIRITPVLSDEGYDQLQ